MVGAFPCHQIFSINYGVVDYVPRDSHRANTARAPNPIEYAFLKDDRFREERELRVSLSTLGMGHFVLADGTKVDFPPSLTLELDFRGALADGTIVELLASGSTDLLIWQPSWRSWAFSPKARRLRAGDTSTASCPKMR